ncbi:MAG: glycosyltransferase [Ruminococcaceae bacterium]|nr:glycosyltransferase [Oscillospiraceae bacterium]
MANKHTICLLNDSFPPVIDGVANAVVNYAKNIEAHHGHAVVATPTVPGADDSAYAFPVLRYPSVDTRKLVGYVTGYPFSPETVRRLQDEHTALLHTHCPIASAILARELRDVLDTPVVLTYHTKFDIDIAKAVKSKILQSGAIRALVENVSACDEVWVVSEGAGENLRSLGYKGDYTVMPNGVDVPQGGVSEEAVAAATAGFDLPSDVPMFLFVGRLMWYKGLRIILDALAALRERNVAFRMVFVGDGGDGKEVRAYASELGLDDVCFFTGSISDRETIRAWYTRADLFLFPSTFDTNGLVVREAAASGTATVMVAGSCAAEGVSDGRNGFFIEENASSLTDKLVALCADRDAMRRVGENAERELYLSWEDAVAHAYERYEIVIDNYRSGRYPKHKKPLDGYLKSQGELMDTLAMIETVSDEMWEDLIADKDELASRFHESQEEVREYFRERQEKARERKEKATERIEELWKKMDRYL